MVVRLPRAAVSGTADGFSGTRSLVSRVGILGRPIPPRARIDAHLRYPRSRRQLPQVKPNSRERDRRTNMSERREVLTREGKWGRVDIS